MTNGYNPQKVEQEITDFWVKNRIYEKARERNRGKKRFYYLDGPPYTSGAIHIGHAWGKALRDSVMRYLRMKGMDVWDRPGFDMHGLPVALKVMEKFSLKTKEDIAEFGLSRFTEECKGFATGVMTRMIADFKRLGVWMDWDNSYIPITREFIEGNWWLIKRALENGYLYEGKRVMHWCASCATSLAKHELEYETLEDDSVFVKFPVEGKKNEFLLVWTTTPWTLPFNLAVMVHPEFEYIRAKIPELDEVWIVSKILANSVIIALTGRNYTVLETKKGAELEGLSYVHPFNEEVKYIGELKKENRNACTVILSDQYVDLGSGTGLVHCAPGCGPEDFEVGHKYKLPPFNNLDQYGRFPDEMGRFRGLNARKDDHKFIEYLQKKGVIVAVTRVEHEYPLCWRCRNPVVFKTTTQWFFDVESRLRDRMIELNKEVYWVPDWAGSRWFDSWLRNLRDNGITRQMTWGTPLPIWRCGKCSEFVVIGSIEELRKMAGSVPDDLHIPYIDEVTIKCRCGGVMRRIPDVLDVWIDAGTTSWNCLDFPHRNDLFEELWPADLILEGKDQIRGWFNLLLVASMVGMERHSYKAVYMHGFINDSQGRKMSKSLGNIISPYEVIDRFGADTLRYYTIGAANPGLDLNYNMEDTNVKHKNLMVLWNIHNFLLDLCESTGMLPVEINNVQLDEEERYIVSRLNSTIKKVTELFDRYLLNEVPITIEQLYLELSRTYIQMVREKSSQGSGEEKLAVVSTICHVMLGIIKMLAPVAPFMTEAIYQNLRERLNSGIESIHLYEWPKPDTRLINPELESDFVIVGEAIQSLLSIREKLQIGVRWPLSRAVFTLTDKNAENPVRKLHRLIESQTNIKGVSTGSVKVKRSLKVNYAAIGRDFRESVPRIVAALLNINPENVIGSIEANGSYPLKIDQKIFEIRMEHITVSEEIPAGYETAELRFGRVFVEREMNAELMAEGFSREVSRRVQALRKKAGLRKTDRIQLVVRCGSGLKNMLADWKENIKSKVGAQALIIAESAPKGDWMESKEKVREQSFEIFMRKVG